MWCVKYIYFVIYSFLICNSIDLIKVAFNLSFLDHDTSFTIGNEMIDTFRHQNNKSLQIYKKILINIQQDAREVHVQFF